MIDYDKLLDNLVPILRTAVSLGDTTHPLIQIPSRAPVPQRDFSSMQILSLTPVGQQEDGDIFDEGMMVRQDFDFVVRVESYGNRALSRIGYLALYIEMHSTTEKLHTKYLTWRGTGTVENLPSVDTSEYEERASVDISFGLAAGYDAYDTCSNNEDNPPTLDPEVYPVESVTVNIYVDDTPTIPEDERLINSITITS